MAQVLGRKQAFDHLLNLRQGRPVFNQAAGSYPFNANGLEWPALRANVVLGTMLSECLKPDKMQGSSPRDPQVYPCRLGSRKRWDARAPRFTYSGA